MLLALPLEGPAKAQRRLAFALEGPVHEDEGEEPNGAHIVETMAAVGETAHDRHVVDRTVGADLVVEDRGDVALVVCDLTDMVGRHQAVGGGVARAHLVVVHRELDPTVEPAPLEQVPRRGRGRRDPGRPGDDVSPHPGADVRVLVLELLDPLVHLGPPRADRRRPVDQGDPLLQVVGVDRQLGPAFARLTEPAAVLRVGEVVPDVAAVDHHLEVHVVAVVGR